MSTPTISAIVWAIGIVLLATPVLRTLSKTFRSVRDHSPWPFDHTGSHWGTGRWMTDSVFGAAGFAFMMALCSLFVIYGMGLLIVVVLGEQEAFARVWGQTVAQTAQFIFTVGLGPIAGFIFCLVVLLAWKKRRRWETGMLEAWVIIPYVTRKMTMPGVWIGRIRRPSGEYVTVLSEITGVPPIPGKIARWAQCKEDLPVNVPQAVNPPVPIIWYWAPTLSPFVVRWERQFNKKQRDYTTQLRMGS